MAIRWHENDPALLANAVRFTAAGTEFLPEQIEKDYFASVLLEYLGDQHHGLTFKGGTALSKIHAGFFRLSEDLDFTISTALEASRADRRRESDRLKKAVAALPRALPAFQLITPLRGANESTRYITTLGYRSVLDGQAQSISIEVGLREPLLTDPHHGAAQTLLQHPLTRQPLVPPFRVRCLSRDEAMAEKLRAALCRRDVAIRDFFDLDHLARRGVLKPDDGALLALVRRKVKIPGTAAVDTSEERMGQLAAQIEGALRPVLRPSEFAEFDLHRAIEIVRLVGRGVAPPQ